MNLWDEWEFKTKDIEHDKEGNEVVRMELILTIASSRSDVVDALTDFLERGLK
jgi:hypothetical protein